MERIIASLVSGYDSGALSRRELIQAIGVLAAGQGSSASDVLKVASINHVSLQVSDLQRSAAFYRRVFGLTEAGSDAAAVRLASGRCHISLRHGDPVGLIDHFAFGVDRFDQPAVALELKRRGAEGREAEQFGFHVLDPDGVHVQIAENDARHR